MSDEFDLVVIGAGPGGYVGALRGAQLGLRTAVVERAAVGGRCLNQACIPAKATLRAADVLDGIRGASAHGIEVGEPTVDFAGVAARRDSVISTLTGGVAGLLSRHRVEVIEGEARLQPRAVVVGDRVLASRAVLVATGSRPLGLPGVDFGGRVIGTEEAWSFDRLPDTLAVVGAGPSGVEVASAYARLGSAVMLIEVADQILPGEDPDVIKPLVRGLRADGVEILTGAGIEAVEATDTDVAFSVGGESRSADWMVLATGRGADLEPLGLDQLGVERDGRGLIVVDGEGRTSVPGISAAGDVVAGPALAHKASEEAIVAVEAIAGEPTVPVDHTNLPRVTFASPALASVGLSETEARAAGLDPTIGRVPFSAVGAGTVLGDRSGLIKIVAGADGEILGAHIVGSRAAELLQQLVDTRALQGGVGDLARIVHSHPTLSEAVGEAARAADGWLIHG